MAVPTHPDRLELVASTMTGAVTFVLLIAFAKRRQPDAESRDGAEVRAGDPIGNGRGTNAHRPSAPQRGQGLRGPGGEVQYALWRAASCPARGTP